MAAEETGAEQKHASSGNVIHGFIREFNRLRSAGNHICRFLTNLHAFFDYVLDHVQHYKNPLSNTGLSGQLLSPLRSCFLFLTLTHTLGREIHYKLFQKFTGEPERGEALGLYCSFFSFVLFYVLVDIFSQEKIRKLSAYCFPTLLLGLNTPFLFSLPIVLNPLFLIPYLLASMLNVGVGYLAIHWNIVPVFRYAVESCAPVFLQGWLATGDVMGTVLQLVWLSLDIVIAREQQVQCHALYCLDG